jgi:hypothetical protein
LNFTHNKPRFEDEERKKKKQKEKQNMGLSQLEKAWFVSPAEENPRGLRGSKVVRKQHRSSRLI